MNLELLSYSKGNLYSSIQSKPFSLSERETALLIEKARFDPRLMEIICEHLRDYWWFLDPIYLNFYIKKNKSPFILKGLLNTLIENCEVESTIKSSFLEWYKLASQGIKDANPQLLYIGALNIGSKFIQREVEEAVHSFAAHNLIVKDLPFNKGIPGSLKSLKYFKTKMSPLDFYKIRLVLKIKHFKKKNNLSNDEMIKKSRINRVFLSQLLNNKFEHISVGYLEEKSRFLK